jgi:ABC-type uncharacterized transport system permease subunit
MQTSFLILAALLYAACALLPARQARAIAATTALAWLLHGAALFTDVAAPSTLRIGFAMMLSSAMWMSVAVYWLENRNLSLDSLRILVLPSAALVLVLQLIFPGLVVPLAGKSVWYGWHIAVAILAYSSLTIAAFHAVLMTLQEARLHATTPGRLPWFSHALDQLPALLTMEKLLFRLIAIGFALLSLTVLSGIVFSEQLFGKALRWDHKNVFALLSWLLFAALLAGRAGAAGAARPRCASRCPGFATLALAYVGSRFVLEVVLHRGFT